MTFVQEKYLDFKDFETPLKWRTRVIDQVEIADFLDEREIKTRRTLEVALNKALLTDNPWQNPFQDS